jgi:hypothetical protein
MVSTYDRLTAPPRQSFFLFGMRGVVKSIWARATSICSCGEGRICWPSR